MHSRWISWILQVYYRTKANSAGRMVKTRGAPVIPELAFYTLCSWRFQGVTLIFQVSINITPLQTTPTCMCLLWFGGASGDLQGMKSVVFLWLHFSPCRFPPVTLFNIFTLNFCFSFVLLVSFMSNNLWPPKCCSHANKSLLIFLLVFSVLLVLKSICLFFCVFTNLSTHPLITWVTGCLISSEETTYSACAHLLPTNYKIQLMSEIY